MTGVSPPKTTSSSSSADISLWNDVCLASAWFDRAQVQQASASLNDVTLSDNPGASRATAISVRNNERINKYEILSSAKMALKLYRSCYLRVRRRFAPTACTNTSLVLQRGKQAGLVGTNKMDSVIDGGANFTKFTINLELRMAQVLRFMAMVHSAHTASGTGIGEDPSVTDTTSNVDFEAAKKLHDDAVSLLVGLFDDEEGDDDDQREAEVDNECCNEGEIDSTEGRQRELPYDQFPGEESSPTETTIPNDGILLTIHIPSTENEKISDFCRETSINDDVIHNPIQVTFLLPTEEQRVRAIAISLNILAQLHARCGDDRAAMDAYREALEILRAATEEGGSLESEDINENHYYVRNEQNIGQHENESRISREESHSPTRPQSCLAATLMNVGNFHLRRDELDAALNAYSTVFALHTGNSLEDTIENSHISPMTPPDDSHDERPIKNTSAGQMFLPHLNSPQTPKSPSTSCSQYTTNLQSYSLEALAALNNLGIVHERRGELDEALLCHDQVRRSRTEILGPDNFDVANSWINVGNCLQRRLEWEKAGEAYEASVVIYRKVMQVGMRNDTKSPEVVRIYRSFAGALRNWGTCYWKQKKISHALDKLKEAVFIEESIVSYLSMATVAATSVQEGIRQAKESMAQLLGIIGCLFVEYQLVALRSFKNSKESFQKAIQIYYELGYDDSYPSIVWAKSNLKSVSVMEEQSKIPPPPPPTPPPKKRATATFPTVQRATSLQKETVEGDSVFSGVDDYENSTDELDNILSGNIENGSKVNEPLSLHDGKDSCTNFTFDDEVSLDAGLVESDAKCESLKVFIQEEHIIPKVNKPLSNEHRNTSCSSFSEECVQDPHSSPKCDDKLNQYSEYLRIQIGSFGPESLEAAEAHVAIAQHNWQRGDRITATMHYTEAHTIYESKLGESMEVATVLKALGDLNKEDEKLDAAKELYAEALDIEMSVQGQYHPQTLNAAGVVCLLEDNFRSAMEYHRRALQIQKKSLGEENKYEMYETLVLIGNVYYSERNNLKNIRSKGVDYKEFIESGFLGWIANAHDMRGEYTKACQFYEESLQISISNNKKESKKETALTLNRLGSLNRELGRYEEALDYHQRAMQLQQSTSNSAKAMTAETCVLIGMAKAKMGEYQKSLDLFEDALLVLKASLGDEHLSVAKTMTQIGAVHLELSNYEQSFSILLEAEEYQLATVGENHRDTLETQALLGRVLSATGKCDIALAKLRSVAERQTHMFGDNHPSIAETKQYLGECYLNQGMISEARVMFVECYSMRKLFFSMDQLSIAESMVDIIRARSGRPERSLAIYRNAMEVYKEYLSDDHVQVGYLVLYEGNAYAELLDFSTAIDRYQTAKEIFQKAFGEGHVVEGDILVNIGKVLLRKCDHDEAKEHFHSALDIYNSKLPQGHPKITTAIRESIRVDQEEALCV